MGSNCVAGFLAGACVGVILHRFRVVYLPHRWTQSLTRILTRLRNPGPG